jgi:hypothetical protein
MGDNGKQHYSLGSVGTREERAWAAGFFDGEGCVSVRRDKSIKHLSGRYPVLSINQTDPKVLERFQNAVGGIGNIRGPYNYLSYNKKTKPQWAYAANGLQCVQTVVGSIWKHLGVVKRAQFTRVMEECTNAVHQ